MLAKTRHYMPTAKSAVGHHINITGKQQQQLQQSIHVLAPGVSVE